MKLSARLGSETISHTRSIGAATWTLAATLTARSASRRPWPSPDHRKAPFGGQRVEGVLHQADEMVVDLIHVRIRSELLAQVNRRERLDRDLGWKGDVAEHVADVETPGKRERDRQHLEAQQPVGRQQPGEPPAAGEEERGLLAADRDDRDD